MERLGKALAAGWHGERDQLMAAVAAYSGLRWGEIAALTAPQLDTAARVIAVDRKVVEVAGHLYVEAPKNRKRRQTIYPRLTPAGYPLAERLTARIEQARTERLLVIRGEVEVARPPAPAPPEDAATPLAAATPTATGDRL